MLDQKKLDSLLAGCRFWEKVQCFETVDSTNLIVKDWARQGAEEGRYAVAEEQTAGRGRRGRSWISPPGENLYFSILLRPQAEASHVAMITLLMAIAVTQGVRELHLDAKIKWPNDVVINGKKICGILTEMYQSAAGSFFLVIGTGINVNQKEFPEEVKKTASSLGTGIGSRCATGSASCVRAETFFGLLRQLSGNNGFERTKRALRELSCQQRTRCGGTGSQRRMAGNGDRHREDRRAARPERGRFR